MDELQIYSFLKDNNLKNVYSEEIKHKRQTIGIQLKFGEVRTYTDKITFNKLKKLIKESEIKIIESTRKLSGDV